MNKQKHLKYSNYLKKRNFKGLIYRNFFLYPKIAKHLSGKCLDIGCGIGDFLKFRGKETYGIDINENTIEYCKSQNLNVKIFDEIIPYPYETFDSILLDNVLEHIDKPNILFKEILRVLNKKGKLLIGVPGVKGFKFDPDHKIYYDENKLDKVIDYNFYKKLKIFYTPFKSNFLNKNLKQYCMYGLFEKK